MRIPNAMRCKCMQSSMDARNGSQEDDYNSPRYANPTMQKIHQ